MNLINNLLELKDSNAIEEYITDIRFQWYWQYTTVYENESDKKENLNDFQFTHAFVNEKNVCSDAIGIIYAILKQFEIKTGIKHKSIIRAKANLLPRMIDWDSKFHEYSIHVDQTNPNCLSLLYYVIDSDGDTFFYDEQKNVVNQYSPIKNNLVYFNSTILHKPSPPIFNKRRIVINIILEL